MSSRLLQRTQEILETASCAVCGAYVHKLFRVCPGCGAARPGELTEAPGRAAGWDISGLPTTDVALLAAAGDDEGLREVARLAIDAAADEFNLPELRPYLIAGAGESLAAGGASDLADATVFRNAGFRLSEVVQKYAGRLGLRYLGGLPGAPSEADITLASAGDSLVVHEKGGREMARVPADQLLFASSFVEDLSILRSSIGIVTPHMVSFMNPTIRSGGLILSYAAEGSRFGFSIGNRQGLFATTAQPEWFRGLVDTVASWAAAHAESTNLVQGTRAYATSLGFEVPEQPIGTSVVASPPTATVRDRLIELDALRDEGLISQDEYAAKRESLIESL
jgi:hypothetical protein